MMNTMTPRDLLLRYPLFALLGPQVLDVWLSVGRERPIELGELLLQAGTPGKHLFLLLQGRVRILQTSPGGAERTVGVAGPGQVVGDYALVPPGTNTASCRASEPGRVLRLPLHVVQQVLARWPAVTPFLKRWLGLHNLVRYLRDECFLGFQSAPSALRALDHCRTQSFQAGLTIQASGLSDDTWFVVQQGQVRLRSRATDDSPVERLLGRGETFGEQALIGKPDLPMAEAVTEVECLALPRHDFYPSGDHSDSLQTLKPAAPPARGPVWVGQRESADCGVAALAMVLGHHDADLTLGTLRPHVQLGPQGASLLELQQTAAALGWQMHTVRIAAEQLTQVHLPAIAHLSDGHFVTLFAAGSDHVVIGDPARGVLTLTLAGFRKIWSGLLLLLRPANPRQPGS